MVSQRLAQPVVVRVTLCGRQSQQTDECGRVMGARRQPILRRDLDVPQSEPEAVAVGEAPVAESVRAVDDRTRHQVGAQGVVREQERVSEPGDVEGRRVPGL